MNQENMVQPPRGTRDLLPKDQKYWLHARQISQEIAQIFGYQRIDIPSFEDVAVFDRSIGENTDIIGKEMYFVHPKTEVESSEKNLALRPEFTAGIVRSYISNGMVTWPQPVKLYTLGSIFRHEKPQKNRYREHTQLDFEILGDASPKADVWIILTVWEFLTKVGLTNLEIQINSLGNALSQEKYRKKLKEYYKPLISKLCETCQKRYETNILRLLDCKEASCAQFKEDAPKTVDVLDPESKDHFMQVLAFLDSFNVAYNLNPYIVRGLDYYTHTAFEVEINIEGDEKKGGSHQIALGGGGRYDGLAEQIGGNKTPGVGVGIGLDRIIEEMKAQKVQVPHRIHTELFIVNIGQKAYERSINLVLELLRNGFSVEFAPDKPTIGAQLKMADKLEVLYSVIIGEREAHDNTCIIRDMKSGIQEDASCDELVSILTERLR